MNIAFTDGTKTLVYVPTDDGKYVRHGGEPNTFKQRALTQLRMSKLVMAVGEKGVYEGNQVTYKVSEIVLQIIEERSIRFLGGG